MKESDYKIYLFSYRHDGATWGFEVKAASPEDIRAMADPPPQCAISRG